ncbi:MAG: hypothetical protein KDD60_07960, partial [Bdellovibrionales bacterium]|nr:hypothetical protein [Bdellovibrionales bacterium]
MFEPEPSPDIEDLLIVGEMCGVPLVTTADAAQDLLQTKLETLNFLRGGLNAYIPATPHSFWEGLYHYFQLALHEQQLVTGETVPYRTAGKVLWEPDYHSGPIQVRPPIDISPSDFHRFFYSSSCNQSHHLLPTSSKENFFRVNADSAHAALRGKLLDVDSQLMVELLTGLQDYINELNRSNLVESEIPAVQELTSLVFETLVKGTPPEHILGAKMTLGRMNGDMQYTNAGTYLYEEWAREIQQKRSYWENRVGDIHTIGNTVVIHSLNRYGVALLSQELIPGLFFAQFSDEIEFPDPRISPTFFRQVEAQIAAEQKPVDEQDPFEWVLARVESALSIVSALPRRRSVQASRILHCYQELSSYCCNQPSSTESPRMEFQTFENDSVAQSFFKAVEEVAK